MMLTKMQNLKLVHGLFALLAVGLLTPAATAQRFRANLDSAQEVAPGGATNSVGTGSAILELNDLGGGNYSLDIAVDFDALFNFQNVGGVDNGGATEATALHIHNAPRGSGGGVVFGIISPSSDTDGDFQVVNNADNTTTVNTQWDTGEGNGGANLNDFVGALTSAAPGAEVDLYFNLHSADDGAGVIRGQIFAVPEPGTVLLLALAAAGLWTRRSH